LKSETTLHATKSKRFQAGWPKFVWLTKAQAVSNACVMRT